MLTFLVIRNFNITVSTTLKYCYKKTLNRKLKLLGGAMKYFAKKLLMKYVCPWPPGLRNVF